MYKIEAVALEHGDGEELRGPELWGLDGEWETPEEAWEQAEKALAALGRMPTGREWYVRVYEADEA